jgi:hypothetical protein
MEGRGEGNAGEEVVAYFAMCCDGICWYVRVGGERGREGKERKGRRERGEGERGTEGVKERGDRRGERERRGERGYRGEGEKGRRKGCNAATNIFLDALCRLKILKWLDSRYDRWLAQPEFLKILIMFLKDSSVGVCRIFEDRM